MSDLDDYDDEDNYDEDENPLEKAIEDCGIGPDGLCLLAGTEFCDFECPFRDGGHPFLAGTKEPANIILRPVLGFPREQRHD